MAADATLVQAAFALGRSRVPGDYSDIFKVQYEGLIAAQKARYEGIGKVVKQVGETITEVKKENKKRQEADIAKDNLIFKDTYEQIATDVSSAKLEDYSGQYEDGATQNSSMVNITNDHFENIKNQLQVFSDKGILSKEDKKMQTDLRSRAEKMKNKLIKHKAGVISTTASYNEDHVNQKLSFIGSPNEQMLFAQVHDPNANWEELGITAFWDDNDELNYTYSNQIQKEYDSSSEVITPSSTISHSKLASMMVLKDIKGNNDANALLTKAGTMSSETIGKTKNLAHKDWSRVKSSIYNDYYSLFMNKKTNIQDLTTREVLVGNTNRTYVNDLGSNTLIDETLINQLGIGSDEFSVEEWRDGKIDANELASKAHEGARAELIQKLTNPQTQSERKVAADELSKYWTAQAKTEFDYIREQSAPSDTFNITPPRQLSTTKQAFQLITGVDEETGDNLYVNKSTNEAQLVDMGNQLSDLKSTGVSSFKNEQFVVLFGNKIGYFPNLGFAPVKIRDDGQLGVIGNLPKGGYWKTPKDVFKHYNIPDMYQTKKKLK